ncbi:hypothetical protein FEZ60_24805 [Rhodococcus sp. MS16]|uniref:hypothetical protein n=1 Tax=Rhodococcus sp. MS16 TaxID=2579941 RepID=UPI001562E988|nr:hypothetical protein [Rhodococcus sp. MS16]NRI68744.1 hypothetical protein [Rhodococcus sp. MS16]
MGFAGAFRRSELVGLNRGDVSVHRLDGPPVRVRWSKTDQNGTGAVKTLPFATAYGGRTELIRLLRTAPAFDSYPSRGAVPPASPDSPLFRSIAKKGILSTTTLFGASIRRRATAAG